MRRRIVVLMHANDNEDTPRKYLVNLLARHWRKDGHEVVYIFGTKQFIPADLIFVHVDLSVVPESYLTFARRYPVAVNGRVRDIRKSTYSHGLLRRGDPWNGRVIVKSDNNAAGLPERSRRSKGRTAYHRVKRILAARMNLAPSDPEFRGSADYPVYTNLRHVPSQYFDRPGVIVQKFIPEMDDGLYCVRILSFLGNRLSCVRLKGDHPIVNGSTVQVVERVEPHPDIVALREHSQFDYGKFDYVVRDGKSILLDANKTVGSSRTLLDDAEMREQRRYRAEGLYDFFL